MRRYISVFSLLLFSVLMLSACAKPVELTNYLGEPTFTGLHTAGEAQAPELNQTELQRVLKHPEEATHLATQVTITLDKNTQLSNGDTVTATIEVPETMRNIAVGGTKTYTVSGLEEANILTNEEIATHLVVNFIGVSGRGSAKIDSTFADATLRGINFKIENDGSLSNGDEARVIVDEQAQRYLTSHGYVLDPAFDVTTQPISGLKRVAANSSEIANRADIERMIQEEVLRNFQDGWGAAYEIALQRYMYRPYAHESGLGNHYSSQTNHGNLVGIFTVKKFSKSNPAKLENEATVIIGYSDIFLDDSGNANVAELTLITDTKDSTYSLQSVYQLYEGYGYETVQ